MKRIIFYFSLLFLISCGHSTVKNDATIKFSKSEYDFKELDFKQDASCIFNFENPGQTPLVIRDVKTSCGCTVPEWPKHPIKPGKSGELKIKYDTSHPGFFKKKITVFYNGENSPVELTITGRVELPDKI
jgi:hypothetical protein